MFPLTCAHIELTGLTFVHPHMRTPSPQLILNLLFTCTLIPTRTRAPPVLQVVYGRPEPSHGTQLQLPAQLNDSVLPQVTELPLPFIFAAFKPSQRSSVYHGIGNVSEMFPAELISLPSPLTDLIVLCFLGMLLQLHTHQQGAALGAHTCVFRPCITRRAHSSAGSVRRRWPYALAGKAAGKLCLDVIPPTKLLVLCPFFKMQ